MTKNNIKLILIWSITRLATCVPIETKSETTKKFHRTGDPIAADDLIQIYEREHQKFYEKKIKDGDDLGWSAIDKENLSNYCIKYLQHSIPKRNIVVAIGMKTKKTLYYAKENISENEVVIVQCNVKIKSHQNTYYILRAPEPNCAYGLKSTGKGNALIVTIINKHCDFEDKPIKMLLKRRRWKIVSKMHRTTSQPITTDEYLLRYEIEHQELVKREGNNGDPVEWLYAMTHPNLNFYCNQYLKECAPSRNQRNVIGKWKLVKLHYQKLNTNRDVMVTTVSCHSSDKSNRYYFMTKALEANCVYALIRYGCNSHAHLVIVFKHCDFEISNDKQTISQVPDKNLSVKTEVKGEIFDSLEIMQLFPNN